MSVRKLTKDEIDLIVNRLPPVKAATKEVANINRQGIMKWMRDCLTYQEFTPEAIQELIGEIVSQHYDSQSVPGTTLGSSAAEAIGAGNTQTALNTFHSSGSVKSVTSTIQLMKELIDVKASRSVKTITIIPFHKNITFEEGLNMRKSLVGSRVSYFVKDFRIFTVDSEKSWWHSFFDLPDSVYFLRLYLNPELLYKHEVTTGIIAKQLENHPDDLNAVVTAFSPSYLGIVDIFPTSHIKLPDRIRRNIEKTMSEDDQIAISQKIFLHDIIIPRLKSLVVKGIDGIENIIPITVPVYGKIVRNHQKQDDHHLLFLNQRQMKLIGMTQNQLFRLIKQINKMVNDNNFITLYTTDDSNQIEFHSSIKEDPQIIIAAAIKMSKNKERIDLWKLLSKDLTDGSRKYSVPYTVYNFILLKMIHNLISNVVVSNLGIRFAIDGSIKDVTEYLQNDNKSIQNRIEQASEYIYLEAVLNSTANEMTTFKEVLRHPLIDQDYTYSNDIHGTAAIFGIEACRNLYTKELNETTKGNISPANILFVAEFVTSKGRPLGTTSTSLHEQGLGHLSQASYEKAIAFLSHAALYNAVEDSKSISASIVMGSGIKAGTGYFDIGCDVDGKTYVNAGVYNNFAAAKVVHTPKVGIKIEPLNFDDDKPPVEIPKNTINNKLLLAKMREKFGVAKKDIKIDFPDIPPMNIDNVDKSFFNYLF